jgi:hypothetical protein
MVIINVYETSFYFYIKFMELINLIIIGILVYLLIKIRKENTKITESFAVVQKNYPIELDDLYYFNTIPTMLKYILNNNVINLRSKAEIFRGININDRVLLENANNNLEIITSRNRLRFNNINDKNLELKQLNGIMKIQNMTAESTQINNLYTQQITKNISTEIEAKEILQFNMGGKSLTLKYSPFYKMTFVLENYDPNPENWGNIKIQNYFYDFSTPNTTILGVNDWPDSSVYYIGYNIEHKLRDLRDYNTVQIPLYEIYDMYDSRRKYYEYFTNNVGRGWNYDTQSIRLDLPDDTVNDISQGFGFDISYYDPAVGRQDRLISIPVYNNVRVDDYMNGLSKNTRVLTINNTVGDYLNKMPVPLKYTELSDNLKNYVDAHPTAVADGMKQLGIIPILARIPYNSPATIRLFDLDSSSIEYLTYPRYNSSNNTLTLNMDGTRVGQDLLNSVEIRFLIDLVMA